MHLHLFHLIREKSDPMLKAPVLKYACMRDRGTDSGEKRRKP